MTLRREPQALQAAGILVAQLGKIRHTDSRLTASRVQADVGGKILLGVGDEFGQVEQRRQRERRALGTMMPTNGVDDLDWKIPLRQCLGANFAVAAPR